MHIIGRRKLELSMEAFCLRDTSVYKLVGEPLYIGEVAGVGERPFAKVTDQIANYWCDAITGQLYNTRTLRCYSAPSLNLCAAPKPTGKTVPRHVPKTD